MPSPLTREAICAFSRLCRHNKIIYIISHAEHIGVANFLRKKSGKTEKFKKICDIFLNFADYLMREIIIISAKGGNAVAKISKAAADEMLAEAFREFGRAIEKYCRVRLGEAADSADDCVQEAFCVYYKRLLSGESIEKPRAFLYRTADNMVKRAKEEYIKNSKRTSSLEDAESIGKYMPEENAADIDYDKIRETLISHLNEKEQALYTQKYVEGLSLKEIGESLGISPYAAANRISRLRTKIVGLMKPILEKEMKGGS